MVYSNSWFFKSWFPPEFWAGVREHAPTVIASKQTHGFGHYLEELEAVDGAINLMPGESGIFTAWQMAPERVTAIWSTQAALGPEPSVALMAAIAAGDPARVGAVIEDFKAVPPYVPPGAMGKRDHTDDFARYNTQVAKYRLELSGLIKAGPMRPPYQDLPESWKDQVALEVAGFAELRAKYTQPAPETRR
jgi:dihydrodipicolinate synthase/N-acetylneuraminate lyase